VAASLFGESLAIWREMGSRKRIASSLESCAALAATRGQPEVTLRLAGTAVALREAMGTSPSALERSRLEPWLREARRALGAGAAETAWAAGTTRLVDAAVAEAVDFLTVETEAALAAARETTATVDLTPRERDVLRLLTAGHADKEIAAALGISRHTAGHHVASILGKLGVASRAAAAAHAVRHGLT
jgi:DNA-binding NarL/FixJ family response regulator